MASSVSSFQTLSSSHFNFIAPNFAVDNVNRLSPVPWGIRFRELRPIAAVYAASEASVRSRTCSSTISFYEVLGVPASATCQEIKAAYRRLARVLHPDAASDCQKDASALEFIKLHDAYSTLSDPTRRAEYDRMLTIRRRLWYYPPRRYTCQRTWETDQCW